MIFCQAALVLIQPAYGKVPVYGPADFSSGIIYVKKGATGTGEAWDNAIGELADAFLVARSMNAATAGTIQQIWVSKGNYKPLYGAQDGTVTTPSGAGNGFVLLKDVAVYGGFDPDNGITDLTHPRILPGTGSLQGSILNGDLDDNDVISGSGPTLSLLNNEGNARRVVIAAGNVGTAVLDGFTIYGGNGTWGASGGYQVNGVILPFQGGGGMYISSAAPALRNLRFYANRADYSYGGAVVNFGTNVSFINSSFERNWSGAGGAGIYCAGTTRFYNVLFAGNRTDGRGGAIYSNQIARIEAVNSTFANNEASDGHQDIRHEEGDLVVRNSIVWGTASPIGVAVGSPVVSNSIVTGGYPGTGNLPDDPLFVNAAAGDYRLTSLSAAVNAGDNSYVPGSVTTDLAGNSRFYESGVVDMGAYELQGAPTTVGSILYVRKGSDGTGRTWEDALGELADALVLAKENPVVERILVSKGVYKPLYSPADGNFGNGDGQNNAFVLPKDVEVYGGFDPDKGISDLGQARILPGSGVDGSVLSGDVNGDDAVAGSGSALSITGQGDNVHHVVIAAGDLGTGLLDGFTIRGGAADTDDSYAVNGATISHLRGGGLYVSGSAPAFRNLRFDANSSSSGAGLYLDNALAGSISNSIFTKNAASDGAAIGSKSSATLSVIGALFTGNRATGAAAAFLGDNAAFTVINATVEGNAASQGAVGSLTNASLGFENSIVWNNSSLVESPSGSTFTATYSIVQGGMPGANNLDQDPLFVNAAGQDYRLAGGSPAVNAGNNSLVPGGFTTDLLGNSRIYNTTVDMGAYEVQQTAEILYVKSGSSGTGSSWGNAIGELADALKFAKTDPYVKQIWVAKGTYRPKYSPADNNFGEADGQRNAFRLLKDVKIYGGFDPDNGITDLTHNRIVPDGSQGSVLTGDSDSQNDYVREGGSTLVLENYTDNDYHVVIAAGEMGDAVLDGFAIRGGSANASGSYVVNGQTIDHNYGSGLYAAEAAPGLSNLNFYANSSTSGGALYLKNTGPVTIEKSIFSKNWAGTAGAAIHNSGSEDSKVVNTLFLANRSGARAAGIYVGSATMEVINATFTQNAAPSGAAVSLDNAGFNMANSIVWSNSSAVEALSGSTADVTYSIVQGGFAGTGNLDQDPAFARLYTNDFRLQPHSPAGNAGSSARVPAGVTTDLDGSSRVYGSAVDMGAYELQRSAVTLGEVLYVKKGSAGSGVSWEDPQGEVADALILASKYPVIKEIRIGKGVYHPRFAASDAYFGVEGRGRNSFLLVKDVKMYGGFDPDNGITDLTHARILPGNDPNQGSVLSGDAAGDDNVGGMGSSLYIGNYTDNDSHIIISAGDVGTAVLDGFTIRGGFAEYEINPQIVKGQSIDPRNGGGMYCAGAAPVMANLYFFANTARYGGVLYLNNCGPASITNSRFSLNRTDNHGAAILAVNSGTGRIVNSLFSGNKASGNGAGIRASATNFEIFNTTFASNSAAAGAAVSLSSAGLTASNTLISGNSSAIESASGSTVDITYSIVQGGYAGTGNQDLDVTFVDPAAGKFGLTSFSSGLNTGNNSLIPAGTTTDLAGNPRIFNDVVDPGAYELQENPTTVAEILYVKKGSTGQGASWADALGELADALVMARNYPIVKQIWVSKGTYYPLYSPADANFGTDDGQRNGFRLVKDVKIYGGFDPDNGITDLTHNRIFPGTNGTSGTVLNGDRSNNDQISGSGGTLSFNSYDENIAHIVVAAGDLGEAVLDGFTIRGGSANYPGSYVVNGQTISHYKGAGLYAVSSTPKLSHVSFYANSNTTGGSLYLDNTGATRITNAIFALNWAGTGGSGMYGLQSAAVEIVNGLFFGNRAGQKGAAMYGDQAQFNLINTTIAGNASASGAVASLTGSTFSLSNGIVWGNSTVIGNTSGNTIAIDHSIVQGGYAGTGNLDTDPIFENQALKDYSLKSSSPAVGAGDNSVVPAGITDDLAGNDRFYAGGTVDMGAYELQSGASVIGEILYVKKGSNGGGSAWDDAIGELADALVMAKTQPVVKQIWVSKGIYKPMYSAADDNFGSPASAGNAFRMLKDIRIYGGFDPDNGITDLAHQRIMPGPYATEGSILNGDLADNDVATGGGPTLSFSGYGENAQHLVIAAGDLGTALLDGFTIKGGSANTSGTSTVNGKSIDHYRGGGLYNAGSKVGLNNLHFFINSATTGGALYLDQTGEVTVSNSVFSYNWGGLGGAGVFGYASTGDARLVNVLILANRSGTRASGLYGDGARFKVINGTFSGNAGGSGGAVSMSNSTLSIDNSIIWGNAGTIESLNASAITANYSIVQGGYAGTAIQDADPRFLAPASRDFRLEACSPAINAGIADTTGLHLPATDLGGLSRIFGDRVDMGAHETAKDAGSVQLASDNQTLSRMQVSNGAIAYMDGCNNLLATLTTTGVAGSASGMTNAKVWIESEQPAQYVKRHYEITPENLASTAVGRVTLCFIQSEFDAFNAVNSNKLPTGPADNAGIARLLVEKRGGVSSDNSGRPTTYPGSAQTISEVAVVWNGTSNRWEVSFDVTGFSGFFVKTSENPLPVRWISFDGRVNDEGEAVLNWKTEELNAAKYQVERSADARQFTPIAEVTAEGDGTHAYTITDPGKVSGQVYYRIRQTDFDGTYSYSRILALTGSGDAGIVAYPNPAKDIVTFRIAPQYMGTTLKIINASGRIWKQIPLKPAENAVDVKDWPAGIYVIQGHDGQVLKLMKE